MRGLQALQSGGQWRRLSAAGALGRKQASSRSLFVKASSSQEFAAAEERAAGQGGVKGLGLGEEKEEMVSVQFRGNDIQVPKGVILKTALLKNGLTPHSSKAVFVNLPVRPQISSPSTLQMPLTGKQASCMFLFFPYLVSTLAPALRHGYWSAFRTLSCGDGNLKFFPLRGLLSSEENLAWSPATFVHCNSKCLNDSEAEATPKLGEVLGRETEDTEDVKLCDLGDTRDGNDSASLQRLDEERRHLIGLDESRDARKYLGSRELFTNPASADVARRVLRRGRISNAIIAPPHCRPYSSGRASPTKPETSIDTEQAPKKVLDYSQRAVVVALTCNFLVFSLKLGVWIMTSSHVMMAEAIHSLADLANQGLIAYGLMSSRRAPDAMHPYGYSKERFVWSLISAVGIFCLGSGATIVHGVQNLWHAQPLENIYLAALVIGGSVIMEGGSLLVAVSCVRNGAKAEGMTVRDYLWRGHDPTTVAVMMEDGAAVTGLGVAGLALTAAHYTGNPIWDPIGSIVVGNLLGAVAIFLIQRNRHALLGRSMDQSDMMRVLNMLSKDPVVDAIYDCKSEMVGPGAYRFKAEIDFNGVSIVQNYILRAGRGTWQKEFQDAVSSPEPGHLDRVMAAYGEEVVSALGYEVDRLERQIQAIVPGIRHVDIETHNPHGPLPREKFYLPSKSPDNLIST